MSASFSRIDGKPNIFDEVSKFDSNELRIVGGMLAGLIAIAGAFLIWQYAGMHMHALQDPFWGSINAFQIKLNLVAGSVLLGSAGTMGAIAVASLFFKSKD